MAYSVVTSPGYDERFEHAFLYRLTYFGAHSAQRLLDAQDRVTSLLETSPHMGALLDQREVEAEEDALRWVRVDHYVAVYQPHADTQTILLPDLFHEEENWRQSLGFQ